jgi:hypothetical protein
VSTGLDPLRDIRHNLRDPNVGYVSNLDPGTPRVIVAFAGLRGGMGPLPVFEFFKGLSRVGAPAAFFRDHPFSWYHRGVRGGGPDIDSIANRIRELTRGSDEVIMLGNSGGAYASLLFAALLGDEIHAEAHAFSPQTFIDHDLRRRYSDNRWAEELNVLVESGHLDTRYADLYPVVSAGRGPFHIYYAEHHEFDRIHAEHLGALDTVTLHQIDSDIHTPIRHLRATGWLHTFLDELVHRPPLNGRRGVQPN